VRRSDFGSRYNVPLRIEPCVCQVSKHFAEIVMGNQPWDVLQERVAWSHFPNDADGVRPHVSFVVSGASLASDRERLAGEARRDNIHAATPRLAVEGSHVVPDGERRQVPFFLASSEHLSAVRVDFNSAHDSVSKQDRAENASTSAAE
jgi:hypothetical protein